MFSITEEHYNIVTYQNDTHELSNKIYALIDLARLSHFPLHEHYRLSGICFFKCLNRDCVGVPNMSKFLIFKQPHKNKQLASRLM